MKNHNEDAYTLLDSVFKGLNVYFNYTGTSECLNYITSSAPTLGEKGWDYQVTITLEISLYDGFRFVLKLILVFFFQSCAEMVMPMCSNGITDIFEEIPWNFDEIEKNCLQTYGVRPIIDIIKKTYGGKNLKAASNIIFR